MFCLELRAAGLEDHSDSRDEGFVGNYVRPYGHGIRLLVDIRHSPPAMDSCRFKRGLLRAVHLHLSHDFDAQSEKGAGRQSRGRKEHMSFTLTPPALAERSTWPAIGHPIFVVSFCRKWASLTSSAIHKMLGNHADRVVGPTLWREYRA